MPSRCDVSSDEEGCQHEGGTTAKADSISPAERSLMKAIGHTGTGAAPREGYSKSIDHMKIRRVVPFGTGF